jgi:hypothetical protein
MIFKHEEIGAPFTKAVQKLKDNLKKLRNSGPY